MIQQWLNWRSILALVAVAIASGTVFYSQQVAQKIAIQERKNVEIWVQAQRTILNSSDSSSINLATTISTENVTIPIIETTEKDSLTYNYINLDSNQVKLHPSFLSNTLADFKKYAPPIVMVISQKPYIANKYYYGESKLLKEAKYYPIVQLIIVGLFVIIIIVVQKLNYTSSQNQLWVGMAKETAHQLGTPVSSLQGWLEMMRQIPDNESIAPEIEKDIQRLLLITDRFGKIGSSPQLEPHNLIELISRMIDYIKKRASGKVIFSLVTSSQNPIIAFVSPPLFDWVIENLLKNALDAMDGKGHITISLQQQSNQICIEIKDTGKGIIKAHWKKIFKPGFTTKKRGWGLGLTLTKRIIEQYHKGHIFIVQSELGKGTTFKIVLPI